MTRRIFFILMLGFFASKATAGFAGDEVHYTLWDKAGRGLENISTGWFELINQPMEQAKTDEWGKALFGGGLHGIFSAICRTGLGVYELATFPIPLPWGYKPLLGSEKPALPVTPRAHVKWGELSPQRVY